MPERRGDEEDFGLKFVGRIGKGGGLGRGVSSLYVDIIA